jgi:regulator of replication initiation timing
MSGKNNGAATAAPDSTEVENQTQLGIELAKALEENKALSAENIELKEELVEAAKIVAELKAKIGNGGSKDVTVTVEKKVYVVTKGFREKNKTWNPEDIAANPAKAKELIEKGSTILKLKKK